MSVPRRAASRITPALLALFIVGCAVTRTPPPVPAGVEARPVPRSSPDSAPATPDTVPAPPRGTPVGTTASGGQIMAQTPGSVALVDSGPSAEALRVLETIPEPLPPSERVPPRSNGVGSRNTASNGAGTTDSGTTPVPVATDPIGQRSSGVLPDSAPPSSGPESPTGAAASAGAAGASAGECWRVQVGAPTEPEKAASLREAAQSQLLLPMVIETESGLYKVRTRDCMSGAAADSLKRRAGHAGFSGSFRFVFKRAGGK